MFQHSLHHSPKQTLVHRNHGFLPYSISRVFVDAELSNGSCHNILLRTFLRDIMIVESSEVLFRALHASDWMLRHEK